MEFKSPCCLRRWLRVNWARETFPHRGNRVERRRDARPPTGRKLVHMQRVLVVDATGRPLMPCRPARARLLCKQGKVVMRLRYPYTILLQEARPEAAVEPQRLKLDPGAKTTGLTVVDDSRGEVI